MPLVNSGVVTMKMISSTSMTSMNGVMSMSAMAAYAAPRAVRANSCAPRLPPRPSARPPLAFVRPPCGPKCVLICRDRIDEIRWRSFPSALRAPTSP